MRITVKNKDIFPSEIRELLKVLHSVGFFEDSILIGSWVMPLYQEVFGIHYTLRKMITSQRRRDESKKDKDLDQCSVIAPQLYSDRLKAVVESLKISKKTQKVIRASCEAIGFPPQKCGL